MLYEKLEFFTYFFCTGPNSALFVNNRSPTSSYHWSKWCQGVHKATGRHSFSKPFASWKHYCSFAFCLWPLSEVILPALPTKKGIIWGISNLFQAKPVRADLTECELGQMTSLETDLEVFISYCPAAGLWGLYLQLEESSGQWVWGLSPALLDAGSPSMSPGRHRRVLARSRNRHKVLCCAYTKEYFVLPK